MNALSRIIPPVKPYFPDEDIERIKGDVEKILRSGMLTMYNYTSEFEKRFAERWAVKHAVSVNSGTSALEIALRSFGLKADDEVLVPTNTFSASAAAVVYAGGRPVLTDIDGPSLCLDAENIKRRITERTRGVVAVHIGGLICPEIREVREICAERGLFLIEDAAHAHGSTFEGRNAGTFGDVGCFSFYPTKVMTTGEGGMITTDDDEVAETARVLRDQGKESFHSESIVKLGYNWRLPEIGAAIGLTQLRRLDEIVERRNKIAEAYSAALEGIEGVEPLRVPDPIRSCYYKYVCFVDRGLDRDELKRRLREKGVRCGGEVYWPPLHLQPAYRRLLGSREGDFPISEDFCRRQLCLPMYTDMGLDDVDYVASRLAETVS